MDYEALILEAQEREIHPELGVPRWGNTAAVQRTAQRTEREDEEDDFFTHLERAYS